LLNLKNLIQKDEEAIIQVKEKIYLC